MSPPANQDMELGFKARVANTTKTHDDLSFEVFEIEIKGLIHAPRKNYPVLHRVRIMDVTKGDSAPIICQIEELQAPDTVFFQYTSAEPSVLPYADSTMPNWTTVLTVPIDALTFPRKGTRNLSFVVSILSCDTSRVLAEATAAIEFPNSQLGYIDHRDNRNKGEVLTAKLAVATSAADGQMESAEGSILQEWIKKVVCSAGSGQEAEAKKRLNVAVEEAMAAIRSPAGLGIYPMCESLKKVATPAQRYEALQLCLKIAQADSKAEGAELKLLMTMAHWLEVDFEKFMVMLHKHLPVHMQPAPSEDILGIHADMTKEEKKKQLISQRKKWGDLVKHRDTKKREQAERMLELLAEAWRRHVG